MTTEIVTNSIILAQLKQKYFDAIQKPKPTYQIGEIKVDHGGYLRRLAEQIELFETLSANDTISIEETFYI